MSRAKIKKMKMRLKRQVNDLMTAGSPKKPSRELVRLCKLYSVKVDKYHFVQFHKINA